MKLELCRHSVDNLPFLSINYLQPPDIIGIPSSILSVASDLKEKLLNIIKSFNMCTHLEMPFADRSRLTVTVNIPSGCEMFQPHEISILDKIHDGIWVSVVWRLFIPLLDDEQVVLVLVGIGSHLLLFCPHTLRVKVEM